MSGMGEPDQIDMMTEHELRIELRGVLVDLARMAEDATALQSRLDTNLPTWCPKCKTVMAHVPHQCGVVERGETITFEKNVAIPSYPTAPKVRGPE